MIVKTEYKRMFTARLLYAAMLLAVVITACDNDRGFFFTQTAASLSPMVIYTNPANGSAGVPVNRKITAAFSEPMKASTVSNNAYFTIKGSDALPVSGSITYDAVSHIVLFSPSGNLSNNTIYTGTITAGVVNVADVPLAADYIWTFTTGLVSDADSTAPLLSVTTPVNNAALVPINQIITATFNEPMDPFTITYTVTAPGPVSVSGTVSYAGTTAFFKPLSFLLSATVYTVTVSGSDLAGNAWAAGTAANPWSFTTGASVHLGPEPVSLGTAGSFRILAGSTITNTGVTTSINDNAGVFPGTSVTGLLPGNVTGTIYTGGTIAEIGKADLLAAYNDAWSRSAYAISLPGQIGGLTLSPGLYVNASSSGISGTGANAILTLDAQGDANATWIFKMGSTFITDANTSVVLINNAQADNIFWQVGSSVTLGTSSIFYGTILSDVSITMTTGATLHGRALTRTGAVTLDTNQVIP